MRRKITVPGDGHPVIPLLAQLVAPPLQNSPVRLPGPDAGLQRPLKQQRSPTPVPVDVESEPAPGAKPTPAPAPEPGSGGAQEPPAVQGLTVYSPAELARILSGCGSAASNTAERLKQCAAALTARLVADGYVNTRVYVNDTPAPGRLEVVEGRIVELRVKSEDPRLARKVQRLLLPLQGSILHLPTVGEQLQLLKQVPGISNVRGNLSRLGSDPAQGVFTVSLERGTTPWQGEFSIRNDGSNGSGEARAVGTVVKADLAAAGDTLLLYGELDSDTTPSLGAVISSISYTFPLSDSWSLTGSFGYSRRNLVELVGDIATNQFQGLGQLEWVFRETLSQRWSLFAGFSGNRSNMYVEGKPFPRTFGVKRVPAKDREPRNGYMRMGINANGINGPIGWGGSAYVLQGIASATNTQQRQELALVGINPGTATALGGLASAAWGLTPRWLLSVRAAGQWALAPLMNSMQFSVGSDAGIRGLPGQLISGDSGWLSTAEASWTVWQGKRNRLQLVPFIGIGGVQSAFKRLTVSDTVGSGGLLARWLQGEHWALELGWVDQFQTDDNIGAWTDWTLANGLYAQVKFRF